MKTKEFSIDSPLGVGWVTGHVTLEEAVKALAKKIRKTPSEVARLYDIPEPHIQGGQMKTPRPG